MSRSFHTIIENRIFHSIVIVVYYNIRGFSGKLSPTPLDGNTTPTSFFSHVGTTVSSKIESNYIRQIAIDNCINCVVINEETKYEVC